MPSILTPSVTASPCHLPLKREALDMRTVKLTALLGEGGFDWGGFADSPGGWWLLLAATAPSQPLRRQLPQRGSQGWCGFAGGLVVTGRFYRRAGHDPPLRPCDKRCADSPEDNQATSPTKSLPRRGIITAKHHNCQRHHHCRRHHNCEAPYPGIPCPHFWGYPPINAQPSGFLPPWENCRRSG